MSLYKLASTLSYKLASTTPALDTGSLRLQLLEEYGEWINDWVQRGWDGYLVTVMFHNLSGSMDSQITQMHQEVTALFSKLVKRVVRKPRSPAWVPLLPKGIFVPDLPVFKRTKTPLNDVVTNNGLHMHGIILAHRWGRLTDPLDVHFSEKRRTYVAGKIRSIDVVKITERPQYTTDYAGKGLKRPCFNPDHILILPRALSELPDHSVPRKTGVRQPGITLTRVGNRE